MRKTKRKLLMLDLEIVRNLAAVEYEAVAGGSRPSPAPCEDRSTAVQCTSTKP